MHSMEQENTIDTLNREVLKQQLQIQKLEVQLKYLMAKIDSINKEGELSVDTSQEPPPPHY